MTTCSGLRERGFAQARERQARERMDTLACLMVVYAYTSIEDRRSRTRGSGAARPGPISRRPQHIGTGDLVRLARLADALYEQQPPWPEESQRLPDLAVVPGVNGTSPQAAISSASQSWRFSSAGTCSKPRSVNGVPSKRSAGVCQSSIPWRRW